MISPTRKTRRTRLTRPPAAIRFAVAGTACLAICHTADGSGALQQQGRLAQLAKRLLDTQKVTGSNPVSPKVCKSRRLLVIGNLPLSGSAALKARQSVYATRIGSFGARHAPTEPSGPVPPLPQAMRVVLVPPPTTARRRPWMPPPPGSACRAGLGQPEVVGGVAIRWFKR